MGNLPSDVLNNYFVEDTNLVELNEEMLAPLS
jgi:hypothetical protein